MAGKDGRVEATQSKPVDYPSIRVARKTLEKVKRIGMPLLAAPIAINISSSRKD